MARGIKGHAAVTDDYQTETQHQVRVHDHSSSLSPFLYYYSSIDLSRLNMSLTFFTEPFYSLADFDRLFDEAFNARASGVPSSTVARPQFHENAASRHMRPR